MEFTGDTDLKTLNLNLKINEGNIWVKVNVKSTNSFSYTTPNTCYPNNNICNIPKRLALRLRRICDDDERFEERPSEYENYLIARDHKLIIVKKQFCEVKKEKKIWSQAKKTKKTTSKTRWVI